MFFGMTPQVFGHTLISLAGIASGFVVAYGLLAARRLDGWTSIFLWTTVMTSVTGFMLPADRILPSHIVGAISLVVLAIAFYARYSRQLAGSWRWIYAVTAMTALYLNVFVLVVQLFLKVPGLKALAPTQSEPPFALAQAAVFVLFVVLATLGRGGSASSSCVQLESLWESRCIRGFGGGCRNQKSRRIGEKQCEADRKKEDQE